MHRNLECEINLHLHKLHHQFLGIPAHLEPPLDHRQASILVQIEALQNTATNVRAKDTVVYLLARQKEISRKIYSFVFFVSHPILGFVTKKRKHQQPKIKKTVAIKVTGRASSRSKERGAEGVIWRKTTWEEEQGKDRC